MPRKSLAVLIVLFALCAQEANAQYRKSYRRGGTQLDIRYGVKVGYQNSNFTGDQFLIEFNSDNKHINPPVEYTSFSSYHGGVYMDVRLQEGFHIQPEMMYSVIGTEMIREVDLSNPEENYMVSAGTSLANRLEVPIQKRLSYLQIPIIAKFGFSRQVYLEVGPVVSFKVSESIVYGDIADSLVTQLNFTNPLAPSLYKGLDYGASLGLTYQMNNGLNFSVRYLRNFNNINKNEGLDLLATEPSNNTRSFFMSVGYTFQYSQRLRESIGRRH